MNKFEELYEEYKRQMHKNFASVRDYDTYVEFCNNHNKTDLSLNDFMRYKQQHMLTEIEYWNYLVDVQKKLKMASQAIHV